MLNLVGVATISNVFTLELINSVHRFPGEVLLADRPDLRIPALNKTAVFRGSSGRLADEQPRISSELKVHYRHILREFAHRQISSSEFAQAVGAFSFVEPLAILAILAGADGHELRLNKTLCVVDIGGGGHTPEFLRPFLGTARYLAFDATPRSIKENKLTSGNYIEHYEMVNAIVTPPGLAELLRTHGVPAAPAVLKIDIDSCDCDVLEQALTHFSPSVVVIEFNPAFPPPIRFNLAYQPKMAHNDRGAPSPIFGCSLSYAADVAQRFGYALLQAPIEDAYFVHASSLPLFGAIPREHQLVFAMGNPLGYAYRDFGAGVLSEWAAWRGEQQLLLRVVHSNVSHRIRTANLMHMSEQVHLSVEPYKQDTGASPGFAARSREEP